LEILRKKYSGSSTSLIKYNELLEELENLDTEMAKNSNKERDNDKSNNRKKQKEYTCDECGEIKKGKYKYNKSKKDNQKFCSDNCFFRCYAETCVDCLEKCVSSYKGEATGFAQTYYSDPQNKTGTLCSKCHQERLKEKREQEQQDKE
jgi:hypothetical protein